MVVKNEDIGSTISQAGQLQEWLDSLPELSRTATTQSISWRAVARALPYFVVENPEQYTDVAFWPTVLSLFSGLFLSRTAIKYPSDVNRSACESVGSTLAGDADGLQGPASRVATAASLIARSASTESQGALRLAVQAVHTASMNFVAEGTDEGSAFWDAIRADVQFILADADIRPLINVPLWGQSVPERWVSAYGLLANLLQLMDKTVLPDGEVGGNWQLWKDWYVSRVEGRASWGLNSTKQRRRVLDRITKGDNRADFWSRHPAVVNSEIADWLRDAGAGSDADDSIQKVSRRAEKSADATATQTASNKSQPKSSKRAVKGAAEAVLDDAVLEASGATSPPPPDGTPEGRTEVQDEKKRSDLEPLSDAVDGAEDHLERADIAYALAGRLNEVWDQMNPAVNRVRKPFDSAWWTGLFKNKQPASSPGFVVHIDAPWGGGKSTFAEYLAQILNPYVIDGPLPAWLRDLPLGDEKWWREEFRRPWHIVRFNAWQHQHVSPPWWVFYETIRHSCVRQSTGSQNLQRESGLKEPTAEFAFRPAQLGWIARSSFWLTERVWRLFTPGFIANVAIAATTIGLLLVLLHFGLISLDMSGNKVAGQAASDTGSPLMSSLIVLLLGGGAAVWKLVSAFANNLIPGTADAAKNYSLGAGDPLKRMRRHFATLMLRIHNPVLVIVDDLDRCDPAFVVELVRGMQTILVSQRIIYLLLGDRDWIEQSFSEVHKAMKGIDVGAEHRFGGRFVEKAIQFSMVLPDINQTQRGSFVRNLLIPAGSKGPAAASPATVTSPPRVELSAGTDLAAVKELEAEAKAVLDIDDYREREAAAARLSQAGTMNWLGVEQKQRFETDMARKMSLRAATDKTAAKGTSHMLEGLVAILPPNPRQIKRIINTLSLLQQVLRIRYPQRVPGSPDWQLLARWVVLMVEWPMSWFTLTRFAALAELAVECSQGKSEDDMTGKINRGKLLGTLPKDGGWPIARSLAANQTVLQILTFDGPEWHRGNIGAAEIKWLSEVMPATSGQLLSAGQVEKPPAQTAAPAAQKPVA